MATTAKITQIGNSVGIVLPKEVLTRLNVTKGDNLYIMDAPDGVRLTAYDEEFAAVMDVARKIMRENRDVLRRLAE